MSTKYKKVAVSDRLLDKEGVYSVVFDFEILQIVQSVSYSKEFSFHSENMDCTSAKYWLEEVPDYEDEMREMLVKVEKEQSLLGYVTSDTHSDLDELLTKLKTES